VFFAKRSSLLTRHSRATLREFRFVPSRTSFCIPSSDDQCRRCYLARVGCSRSRPSSFRLSVFDFPENETRSGRSAGEGFVSERRRGERMGEATLLPRPFSVPESADSADDEIRSFHSPSANPSVNEIDDALLSLSLSILDTRYSILRARGVHARVAVSTMLRDDERARARARVYD